MALLSPEDVLRFLPDEDEDQVKDVVDGLCARVRLEIPGLTKEDALSADQKSAVKDILRRIAIRSLESASGLTVTEAAPGGWSQTVQAPTRRALIYENEWDELRKIVNGAPETDESKAFTFASGSYFSLHDSDCSSLAGNFPCDCTVRYPPVEVTPLGSWF